MQTAKVSGQAMKRSYVSNKRVCEGDNPDKLKANVQVLMKMIMLRRMFYERHRLMFGGFDLLILISYNWVVGGIASTVYTLSNEDKDNFTKISCGVKRLLLKGLVEVVGPEKQKGRQYVPSDKAIKEFQSLGIM